MQRLISKERREIEPLKAQLQTSHEKLLAAAGQGHETEALAAAEARILTRLLIKSAHMQATLRNLLTPEQQKKLEELGTYSER
jgi:Spy/CpxP family protein refolding chaperone